MEQQQSIELKWITAPSDGVGQALLLTIRKSKRHTTPLQYLFNAPEGFSRLVLEHRCRPGPGLRALFLTDLSQEAQGGLGGLLLRLRQDGHAALRVVGPAGLHDTIEGLSYFVRWMHPALELTAITSANQGCVYDDECLEVRPIWPNSLLWQVPPWLNVAAEAAHPAVHQALKTSQGKETAGEEREASAAGLSSKARDRKPYGTVAGAASHVTTSTRRRHRDASASSPRGAAGSRGKAAQRQRFGATPAKACGADDDTSSASEAWDSGSCSTTSTSRGAAAETDEGSGRGRSGRGQGRERRGGRRSGVGVVAPAAGTMLGRECSGAVAGNSPQKRMKQASSSSTSSSSTSSSSTSSSSTSSSSSESENEEDDKGASMTRASKRRRGGHRNNNIPVAVAATGVATAAGPGSSGAATSNEDLFSKLDRLFMAGGNERRGFGAHNAANRQGIAAGRASGVSPGEAAAMPDSGVSMTLRARILEELHSTVSEHGSRGQKCPTAIQSAAEAMAAKRPAATSHRNAKSMAAPAAPAPPLPARRPTDNPPLAYLLYLKHTRQAVLVVCTGSRGRIDALAAHPATALLRRTPPGLLLAVVNMAATAATSRWQYRRHVQATLPGPQVWPDFRPASASAAPLAGLGHVSSARVTMRLNAVAPVIFPLPYQVRIRQLAAARRAIGKKAAADVVDQELEDAIAAAAAAAVFTSPSALTAVAQIGSQLKYGEVSEPNGDEEGHRDDDDDEEEEAAAAEEAGSAFNVNKDVDGGDAAGFGSKAAAGVVSYLGAQEGGSKKARPLKVVRDGKLACTADRTAAAREGSVWKTEGRIASLLDTLTCTVVHRDGGGGAAATHAAGSGMGRGRVPAMESGEGPSQTSGSADDESGGSSGESSSSPSSDEVEEEGKKKKKKEEEGRKKKKEEEKQRQQQTQHQRPQSQPEVIVQWWDDRGGAGAGATAPAPASAPEPVVLVAGVVSEQQQQQQQQQKASVGEVQRALLRERRGSGLANMLTALRTAFPHLARSSDTERRLNTALRAPKPPHEASVTVRQQHAQDSHVQQQQHEGHGGRPPLLPAVQQPLLPQDFQLPYFGCDNRNGGWHTVGPAPLRALSAEKELAEAAAAYGVPERTGTVMRPWYSYQVSYTTDQNEHGELFPGPSGSSGQPPQWQTVNGDVYGYSQQPTRPAVHGVGAHAGGDSWQLHPVPPRPYSNEPNQLNHITTHQGNGWQQNYHQPQQPTASSVAVTAYGMSRNAVPSQRGMASRPPWPNAPRSAESSLAGGGGGGGGGSSGGPGTAVIATGHSGATAAAAYDVRAAPAAAAVAAPINAAAAPASTEILTTLTVKSNANQLVAAKLRSSLKSCAAGGVSYGTAAATTAAVEVVKTAHTGSIVRSGIGAGASEAVKVSFEEVEEVGETKNGQSMGDGDGANNWTVARRVRRRLMASVAVRATAAPGTAVDAVDLRRSPGTTAAAQRAGAETMAVAAAVAVAGMKAGALEAHPETVAAVAAAVANIDLSNRGIAEQLRAALRGRGSSGGGGCSGAELQSVAGDLAGGTAMEESIRVVMEEDEEEEGRATKGGHNLPAAAVAVAAATDDLNDVPDCRTGLSAAAASSLEAYLAELHGSRSGSGLPTPHRMAVAAAAATSSVGDAAAGGATASKRNPAAVPLQPVRVGAATATDDIPPPACLQPAETAALAAATTTTFRDAANVSVATAAVTKATAAATAAPVGDVSVLFLGTGCAEPSKYRGASAVLVMGLGPNRGSLLIDAGEGTYGAMVRWLGGRGAMEQVAGLELIWISHKHPDHLLGLPALLEARGRGRRQMTSLLVVGPSEAGRWLDKLAPLHPSWRYTFLHCAKFSGSAPAQLPPPQPGSHPPPPRDLPQPLMQQRHPAQLQQQQQQQQQHISLGAPRPSGPYWQPCPCCPPYGPQYGDINNTNLTGGATAAGWFLPDHPPPPLPAKGQAAVAGRSGLCSGTRAAPSAAARRWWHQRQKQLEQQQLSQQPPPPPKQQQWSGPAGASAVPPLHDGAEKKETEPCRVLGLVRWHSVAVHHCRDAWGLVLEHRDGWKLVYSGDTRPCPALISAGRGATLLIHEATFEPCLESQARTKRHCTSAEAAGVADAMGAYRTVLTHFSQRYPRTPAGVDPTVLPLRRRPVPAFDGMLLPLAVLQELPHIVPPLAVALMESPENAPAAV